MLYFFRFLLLLINIDQKTILTWFGVENPNPETNFSVSNVNHLNNEVKTTSPISLETVKLLTEGLWERIQDGLTLADIENILFFILFIRFIILATRYNIKTSFYITCIGLIAGYLWYRHLIDLISMYSGMLIRLPYLRKLGMDGVQLTTIVEQLTLVDINLGNNVHWYNPGQLIYYAFINGIIKINQETGLPYYIDPISMLVSNLSDLNKSKVLPFYYEMYNELIPQLVKSLGKFWTQLSGMASYALITRIGKRYCPYLIRWHWTFLIIIGFVEQVFLTFVSRISYFQENILIPQTIGSDSIDSDLILQIDFLNGLSALIISFHLGLIFFGLFHAIWGQYFYFPVLVENTELHIGQRPKNSIYSGGNTAWQEKKQQNAKLKLWYGWFGSGKTGNWNLVRSFINFIIKTIKKLIKQV